MEADGGKRPSPSIACMTSGAQTVLHTIRDYVDHQAQERPDAVYLVAPETGRTLTFAGLQRSSRRLANYLAALGIGPGHSLIQFKL